MPQQLQKVGEMGKMQMVKLLARKSGIAPKDVAGTLAMGTSIHLSNMTPTLFHAGRRRSNRRHLHQVVFSPCP
jgi:hypothetical protein